jgi:mRNA interferase MazF
MPRVPLTRGDVVYVDLVGAKGAETMKTRPCVVVQNDVGNKYSPLTIVLPLTDAQQDKNLPVQISAQAAELWSGAEDGVIEGGHVRTIDRDARIDEQTGVVCHLSDEVMAKVDHSLAVSLGLTN